ncbi:MAG: peptide-methionine (R)-S-oxide reductase MsrB [Candidatus Gracilibacteria bacterium]|nr:peptide-methionine (R)-S-oxide reductase MsrB [Candidatus Gracilibacteria bacterium]
MSNTDLKEAYFAGGCFWCMEGIFEAQDGVKEAISGYAGGSEEDATYDKVSTGNTNHREAVKVVYDPSKISYERLVELYWSQIDPTDPYGQFADKGYQYTTAIIYENHEEKAIAESSKKALQDSKRFDKDIATLIIPFTTFYSAEEYHQDYYKKSSFRYNLYKKGSGREYFIKKYNKPESTSLDFQDILKKKLTPLQYKVTQEAGTEKPFDNEYWDNHEDGIYVDVIDGTPLFSSKDKFDSGTGWPSFTKPIDDSMLDEQQDNTLFSTRTEIRSKNADSHLGHVFDDGPTDKGGLRYCINSAAMKFVPLSEMKEKGYEKYSGLF